MLQLETQRRVFNDSVDVTHHLVNHANYSNHIRHIVWQSARPHLIVSTLIAALVLLAFGTGPIKGFAITLSLGIMTSMFTAIVGTRIVVGLIYDGRRMPRLAIGGSAART